MWAYPDDEAYLTADPMSVARAAGTQWWARRRPKGELGTGGPVALPPDRLALIRERETGRIIVDLCRPWNYADHRPGEVGRGSFLGPWIGIVPLAS